VLFAISDSLFQLVNRDDMDMQLDSLARLPIHPIGQPQISIRIAPISANAFANDFATDFAADYAMIAGRNFLNTMSNDLKN
jgi:hypothetical protein